MLTHLEACNSHILSRTLLEMTASRDNTWNNELFFIPYLIVDTLNIYFLRDGPVISGLLAE